MKLKTLLSAAAVLAFGAGAVQAADPVKIPISEWTGQHITAHILGSAFKEAGVEIEYVTAGSVPQYAAIAAGDLHLQPETWDNNVGDIYPKAVAAGDIVVVGETGLTAREGWIYPPYMEEKCPGLPSYKALYDCAQAFATAETFPKGRMITYPADWGTRSRDLINLVKLPFVPVPGGSEGAMVAEMKSALATEQPVLVMFWEPHWFFADYEMNWVEWPTDVADCDTDPSKGITTTEVGDCGFQQANVLKIANKDFAKTWPKAQAVYENFTINNGTQNQLIKEVDANGRPLEEVIAEWMANNESTWKAWLPGGS